MNDFRRLLAVVVASLAFGVVLAGCGGGKGYPGEPLIGINGMEWGTSIQGVGGLGSSNHWKGRDPYFHPIKGHCTACEALDRPRDPWELGGLSARYPVYITYQGRLCAVMLSLDGDPKAREVYDLLEAEYGKPHKRTGDGRIWRGEQVDLEARVGYAAVLLYTYGPIFEEIEAAGAVSEFAH